MALFFRRGKSRLYFCPAIASPAGVTAAELAAGKDLGPVLSDLNGFQLSNNPIPTPNLASIARARCTREFGAAPAHHAVLGQVRPFAGPRGNLGLLLGRKEPLRPELCVPVAKPCQSLLAGAMHPVAQRLTVHPRRLRRLEA